jgi:hypothetical protein
MSMSSSAGFSGRFKADLSMLEAAVMRAGETLACCYSSADEYEAEVINLRRAAGAFDRRYVKRFRMVLGITLGAMVVALCILAL